MNKLSTNELKYIISRLLQNATDAAEEKGKDDFTNGKKLAYYEMLDTIKNELIVRDIDLSEFEIDFVLENLL